MIKNVLIVDDDREMLVALKDGFSKYKETFSVLISEDGTGAVNILKEKSVSLVVTDLKMPQMDGFALLTHVMENYPDIPVIIITGYSTPDMERLAHEGGAVGYIAKPFMLENLAKNIMTTLRKESEGGTLHSVSSGIFLQLMEMEQKTCTIRLEDKASGKKGVLFFQDGELLDARVNNLQGKPAAYITQAVEESEPEKGFSYLGETPNIADLIGSLAAQATESIKPAAIIVVTRSGYSALMVSKHRPRSRILAVTKESKILKRMQLYWGVESLKVPWTEDRDELILRSIKESIRRGFIMVKDHVMLVSGSTMEAPGRTTTFQILRVSDVLYYAERTD